MDRSVIVQQISDLISDLNAMGNAELSSIYRNDNIKFKVMNYFDSSSRLISNHLIKGHKEVSIKDYLSNIVTYYPSGIKYNANLSTLQIERNQIGKDGRIYQEAAVQVNCESIQFYRIKKETLYWQFTFVYVSEQGWKINKIWNRGKKINDGISYHRIGQDFYFGGNNKSKDYNKASKWFKKSAKKGNIYGQI